MKCKFKVGQVVRWENDVWEIGNHYSFFGEDNFYMLKLKQDDAYELADEKDIKPLTKRQRG